ncbi:MAG: SpoIIE family protein phosphatase [Leptospirales bacterium]
MNLSGVGSRWWIRSGFDPAWLEAALPPDARERSETNSPWREIAVSENFFRDSRGELPPGLVTLRTRMPETARAWLRNGAGPPLALHAGRSGDQARYYIGGRLIEDRDARPGSAYGFQLVTMLPRLDVAADAPVDLSIVLVSSDGGLVWHEGDIQIGPAEVVFAEDRKLEILALLLIGVYLVVGCYHLLLSAWRWSDRHNFYFGVFCVCVFSYWFTRTHTSQVWLPIDGAARTRFEFVFLFAIGPLFMQALAQLILNRVDRVAVLYGSFCALLGLVAGFAPFAVALRTLAIWQVSALLMIPYTIFFVARAAYRGNVDARYLVAGVVIQMLAALYDIMVARSILNTPQVGQYTFLVFVLGIAVVLAHRFMRVHNEVEELNATLETKVLTRTEELKHSLDNVRSLKQKQDGDYFLTSLLLKPLGGNYNRLRSVEIQIFERQFKRFYFRKRELEIGGDFSTSQTIQLRNGPCGVFLNGDAMGKSMQGAGGALVLGTVFKAILQRTLRSPEEQNKPPEFWLRDMFEELQAVFESFDGSMLVSLVAGVIEERSGMFYWINAGHPRMIIYREGRAEFLEAEARIRKLGVHYFEDQALEIRTRRLNTNDVVISGSDGRDDLLIGFDADGGPLINEDELEFLRRVEEGDGLPERILKAMARHGRLTDDLSLVRVSFREDFSLVKNDQADSKKSPGVDHASPGHGALLSRFEAAFAASEWLRALALGEELDRDYGLADEALFRTAVAASRGDEREAARIFGGRYILRAPAGPAAAEIQAMISSDGS